MIQNMNHRSALWTSLAAAALAGVAQAKGGTVVEVSSDITTSQVWDPTCTYVLTDAIYVRGGATLTIPAGTVVASRPAEVGGVVPPGPGGSLVVTTTGTINILGTADNPVIMTSDEDVATWTGGDPKTGTWRAASEEWGNLTIMGEGYISENNPPTGTNSSFPDPSNIALMEGLTPPGSNPEFAWYGGGNDDDNSGTIEYLSLRYGGRVIGLANELNGISLGGIGRGTDMNHIEIMNNVDDGIEIWGGTVNLKNVSIWNIGDDSFDLDQGWRGKAQFGLIVQGYSKVASQESGVADRCFEVDGAEADDFQPVVTGTIYNFTVIGLPGVGRAGLLTRDNAHLQVRNSIFMDLGTNLVEDGGDYATAPGFPSYAACWTTPWTHTFTSMTTNAFPGPPNTITQAQAYQAQVDGTLLELSDSVFFRNQNPTAYNQATAVGVLPGNGTNNNVQIVSIADADMPIQSLTRDSGTFTPAGTVFRVTKLDPRAKNEATTSAKTAPADGFFTPANYRGAFSTTENWLSGWTAADAFGFLESAGTAVTRNGAGNVQDSLIPNGLPEVGNLAYGYTVQDPQNVCSIDPFGELYVVFTSFGAPTPGIPFAGFGCNGGLGTVLLNIGTSVLNGPLVKSGLYTGTGDFVPFAIPANPVYSGVQFTSQAVFVDVTLFLGTLGSAVDNTVGA